MTYLSRHWIKNDTKLDLRSNQIEKIEGLDKLTQLTTLYLYNNKIKNYFSINPKLKRCIHIF